MLLTYRRCPASSIAAGVRAARDPLYSGVFSGGIAFTLQLIGQRYTTAPQAAIFLSTEAVFAALFGAVFLGERLPPAGFAGCGLILSAIILTEVVPALRSGRPWVPNSVSDSSKRHRDLATGLTRG